jgi:predicted CoA-binding protein
MNTREILGSFRKIAVLGLSPNEDRPSHYVSEYMKEQGYEITGVNPGHDRILGRPVYAKLSDVPGPLEIVAVFRSSEHLAKIVDEAIPLKPKVLWIQLGIEDAEAEAKAEKVGILVVRRRCLMVEHQNL